MARAGGPGGARGGGGGGRSFGGRSGGAPGGSYQRGGVRGGGSPGRPSSQRPGGGPAAGPRPGGVGGFGPGFGGYGGYGGYYGGYGRPVPPPPPRRRRGFWGYPGGGYYGGGCFTLIVVMLLVALMSTTIFAAPLGEVRDDITPSTHSREKLPDGAVIETAYYTDNLGWVRNPTLLLPGMEHFYDKTGVQPHLYLTDNIGGTNNPSDAEALAFASELYDEIFDDEGHFLLIFLEYGESYHTWYLAGSTAASVMDLEACNILLDYVDKYYTDSKLSDEEYFSMVFKDSANRIMNTRSNLWVVLLIVAGIAVLLLVIFLVRRSRRTPRYDMRELDPREYNTPLETAEDSPYFEVERGYSDDLKN